MAREIGLHIILRFHKLMYSHHSSLCFFGNVSFTEVIGLIWGGGGVSLRYFSRVQSVAVVSCIWERGRILERKWNKLKKSEEKRAVAGLRAVWGSGEGCLKQCHLCECSGGQSLRIPCAYCQASPLNHSAGAATRFPCWSEFSYVVLFQSSEKRVMLFHNQGACAAKDIFWLESLL